MTRRFLFICVLLGLGLFSFAQDSLYQLALTSFVEAKFETSYQQFKQASQGYLKLEKQERYALSNLKMAECLVRSNNFNEAITHIENSRSFINQAFEKNTFLLAESDRIEGEALLSQGKLDSSLKMLLEAAGKYPENAELEQAEVFNLLGVVYGNNQNTSLALQYHQKALAVRKALLGDSSVKVADSYNNLGLLYLSTEPLQASIYLTRSLTIYEQTLGTLNPKVGFSMINLARSKAEQNRFMEAETLIKKADQLWVELYGDFDNPNKAFTHAVLGQIVEGNGDIDRSLQIQQEALQLYIRIYGAQHPDVANQYQLIGKLHRKNGDIREAIFAFQEAIYANLPGQQFKSIYDLPTLNGYFHPDYLLSAIMDKATTLEALHFDKTLRARELTAAISTYELADQLLNEIRRYRVNEIDKLRLGETSRQIYESSIKLLDILGSQPFQAKKYYPQIFDFIEKSKASVLLQAIQDTKAASYAGLPESILAQEDSLKSQIAYYQQRVAEDGKDQEAIDLLFSYQTTYRDFISQLEKDYPAYYELKHSRRDVSISEISRTLPDQTAIIQYFLGKENLTITWLHQGSVKTEVQPIDEQLAKDIAGFRNSIKHNIRKVFESTASRLHNILIPTLDPSITELILIPDGILNTVPFEALFDIEDETYLIERYAVSYSFAAAIATAQMQKVKNDNGDILLMAPVNFNHTSNKLPSLPGTEKEVRRLSVLFRAKGLSATTYVKNKAVESRLNSEELGNYSYLHFATHGEVNQSSPELSKIYLSAEEGQDGSLYSGEIYNLKLNASLVSLSACETGLGKIAQGEGIVGLSRALIYAGADNLVVSLWKVSDQATTEMMSEFYNSHLFSSYPGFTSSLRAAKLFMISSEQYKAPYYWAPFILIGY